jgi:uncharacterized membrane protein
MAAGFLPVLPNFIQIFLTQSIGFQMSFRPARERFLQLCSYEILAAVFAIPLYSAALDQPYFEGGEVVLSLLLADVALGCLHDICFDRCEFRLCGRRADLRPLRWRICHAASRELVISLVSVPLIVWLSGIGWAAALGVDLGLTAFYLIFSLVFFRAYDWLRPMKPFPLAVQQPS